jgi:hypothetical protein
VLLGLPDRDFQDFPRPFISLFNAHFSLNIAHTARGGVQPSAQPNSADKRGTVFVVEFPISIAA